MPAEETFDPSGPSSAPRQKRGCLGKTFIVLGIITAVFFALCCGGGVWIINIIKGSLKETPDEIAAVQQKIADIDVPEDLPPAGAIDLDLFGFFNVQLAAYGNQVQIEQQQGGQAEGQFKGEFLLIFQTKIRGLGDAEMEHELRKQSGDMGANIRVESSEIHKVMVDGEELEFEFAQGTNTEDNTQVRSVSGVFHGRGGPAFLMLVVPEDSWNEEGWNDERAIQLLESIHK